MTLLCLLLGHRWFRTVSTEAPYEIHGLGGYYAWRLGYFHERICTRCNRSEARWVEDIERWEPSPDRPDMPSWGKQPPEHFPLTNDWRGVHQ